MSKERICGAAFEDLTSEEMYALNGGSGAAAASAAATTMGSSVSCLGVSALVSIVGTCVVLITAGKW